MRRLLTWGAVTLGIAALARRLRRGTQDEITPGATDDPADELRRKLAESRAEDEEAAVAEPPVSPAVSVEERRAALHEEGRATLDEMREPNEG